MTIGLMVHQFNILPEAEESKDDDSIAESETE